MEELKVSQLDKLDKLTVYANDRILLLKIQDILYCTSEDSKTVVVTEQGRFCFRVIGCVRKSLL